LREPRFLLETEQFARRASTGFVIPYVQWGMKNPSNFLLNVSERVELTVQATGRVQYN